MSENIKKMDAYSEIYQKLGTDSKNLNQKSINKLSDKIEELNLDDEAIESFKDRISGTAEDAKNKDFISSDKIILDDESWSEGKITFTPREDGTYLIKKILNTGEEIAMGFTDKTGVEKFLSINDSINKNIDENKDNITDKTNDHTELPEEKIEQTEETNTANPLQRTGATIAVGAVSIVEGVLQFGEGLAKVGAILGAGFTTIFTGTIDAMNYVDNKITGKEYESTTKKLWNQTNAFVSKQHIASKFDKYFYEGTETGQYLKQNSYAFEPVRKIGNLAGTIIAGNAASKLILGAFANLGNETSTGLSVVEKFGEQPLTTVEETIGEVAVNYGDDAINFATNSSDDIARIGVNTMDDAAKAAQDAAKATQTAQDAAQTAQDTIKAAQDTAEKLDQLEKVYDAVKNGEIKSMSEARKAIKEIYPQINDGSQAHEVLAKISRHFRGK